MFFTQSVSASGLTLVVTNGNSFYLGTAVFHAFSKNVTQSGFKGSANFTLTVLANGQYIALQLIESTLGNGQGGAGGFYTGMIWFHVFI